ASPARRTCARRVRAGGARVPSGAGPRSRICRLDDRTKKLLGGHGGGAQGGPKNYSGVTAACLMTGRAVWDEVGGFNEQLAIDFNDVDYCLKVRRAGYRIVFTPYAELYHYESTSHGQRTWRPA